jgi:hypothetical protein
MQTAELGCGFTTAVQLRDGGSIRIRAIRADDKARLLEHFSHLSERSAYQRFLGIKKTLTPEDLVHFTELDFVNAVGLVATLGHRDVRFGLFYGVPFTLPGLMFLGAAGSRSVP